MAKAKTRRRIYLRHKRACKHYGKPDGGNIKCACPIYAQVSIVEPSTGVVVFDRHASISALGIRNMPDAERLVDSWFSDHLSGRAKTQDVEDRLSLTVEQTADAFLERLIPTLNLKPWHGTDPKKHPRYKKYATILNRLVSWSMAEGLVMVRQLDTDSLIKFQQSWQGWQGKAKTQTSRNRDQQFMRKFFDWAQANKYTAENPCNTLERIKAGKSEPKPFTAAEVERLFALIPATFPLIADNVYAFLSLMRYSGGRLSAVCTAEVAQLENDGIWLRERKTEGDGAAKLVWCLLPTEVVEALRNITPKSREYFFWSGVGRLETVTGDWSAHLLKLYRAAGIEGKRSHEWRDTMGKLIQETEGTDLEHVQLALSHENKNTTQKHYVGKNRRKYAELDEIKRKAFGMASTSVETAALSVPTASVEVPASDPLARIKEAAAMLSDGLIDTDEFKAIKRAILS
jgi:integrase